MRPTSSVVIPNLDSNREDVDEVIMDQTVYTMLPKNNVMKMSFSPRNVRGASTVLKVTLFFSLIGTAFSCTPFYPVIW